MSREKLLSPELTADLEAREILACKTGDREGLVALQKDPAYGSLIADRATTKADARQPASPRDALVLALVEVEVARAVTKRAYAQLQQVEKRVAELEQRMGSTQSHAMTYRGIFRDSDAPYRPNEACTHGGGLWHCQRATHARPGTSDDWQLMAKTHWKDKSHGKDR